LNEIVRANTTDSVSPIDKCGVSDGGRVGAVAVDTAIAVNTDRVRI
jgi:hypothetical protein